MAKIEYPFVGELRPAQSAEWRRNGDLDHLSIGDDRYAGLVEPVTRYRATFDGREIGIFEHRWQAGFAVSEAAGLIFFSAKRANGADQS